MDSDVAMGRGAGETAPCTLRIRCLILATPRVLLKCYHAQITSLSLLPVLRNKGCYVIVHILCHSFQVGQVFRRQQIGH